LNGLSCEELCWHGFCIVRAVYAAAFDAYLYALGQHAKGGGLKRTTTSRGGEARPLLAQGQNER